MVEYNLHSSFDIEKHKATFIDYLEVIINTDGKIMYAVPSHQEKLIRLACDNMEISRTGLLTLSPRDMYCDFMVWLCRITGAIAVWNDFYIADQRPNDKQLAALRSLSDAGLYKGVLT